MKVKWIELYITSIHTYKCLLIHTHRLVYTQTENVSLRGEAGERLKVFGAFQKKSYTFGIILLIVSS